MKKTNKTLKALIIVHEMNGVRDGQYLTFAEKMWEEEFPYLFVKSYGTGRGSCVGKGPRFMAGSFLARLRKKGLTNSSHEPFCGDCINIREVSHEGYKYIKENISGNLPLGYIELIKECLMKKDFKYSLGDLYGKPHERNSNLIYRRFLLLESFGFVKGNCDIKEIIFQVTEKGIEEMEEKYGIALSKVC